MRRALAILLLAGSLAGCGLDVDLTPDDRYASTDDALDDLRESRAFDAPPFRGATPEADRGELPALTASVEEDDDLGTTLLVAAETMEGFGLEWLTATCAVAGGRLALVLDGSDPTDETADPFDVRLATGEEPGTIVLRVEVPPQAPPLVPDPGIDASCPGPVRDRVEALVAG